MLAGLLFTFVYIVYFKFIAPEQNSEAYWWFGISPEGIGAVGALLNFLIAAVVCRLGSQVPEEVQTLVHNIRVPRGVTAPREH